MLLTLSVLASAIAYPPPRILDAEVTVSCKTTSPILCRSLSPAKTRTREALPQTAFGRVLQINSAVDGARTVMTAGQWAHANRYGSRTTAYVTHVVCAAARGKVQHLASTGSDAKMTPTPASYSFTFRAQTVVTGTLVLTLSGSGSQGATACTEIQFQRGQKSERLTWTYPSRLVTKTFNNVTIDGKGLVVTVSGCATASLAKKGRVQALARAAVCFEVRK